MVAQSCVAALAREPRPVHRYPNLDPWFAHQFGWDEILMFAVPIVLALLGVRYVESRVAKRQEAEGGGATEQAPEAGVATPDAGSEEDSP